ncbi:TadE family protein [Blautia sp. HCP3S3_H10_1]|uniref:TadE family protein n=1 Tax=unclassified Blautia TaxID=2648079 RepID=UPI003F903787|nr:pilus assembly protein [Clostridia bacterium]
MKRDVRQGSLTIEAALLMPVILLVLMVTLYLFFYMHNKAWLTAAAYEAVLDGSMEAARPDGKIGDKALKKGKELGNTGFFSSKNLKLQASEGNKIQVIYNLDVFSVFGGINSHLQVQGNVKVIKPVSWIRKVKGATDVVRKLRE